MAEQVASRHDGANDLIGKLREVAVSLQQLGDGYESLRDLLDGTREENERLAMKERSAINVLAAWTDLLEDFRRGVRDADELIERTVGR